MIWFYPGIYQPLTTQSWDYFLFLHISTTIRIPPEPKLSRNGTVFVTKTVKSRYGCHCGCLSDFEYKKLCHNHNGINVVFMYFEIIMQFDDVTVFGIGKWFSCFIIFKQLLIQTSWNYHHVFCLVRSIIGRGFAMLNKKFGKSFLSDYLKNRYALKENCYVILWVGSLIF